MFIATLFMVNIIWKQDRCPLTTEWTSCYRKVTPSRAQNWALVYHSEMNCLRRCMCWKSKRFYWERVPGWRGGGWGKPGEHLCHVACRLRFYGDGISFQVVFSLSFWLRVLPGGVALFSQGGCQREGFWEVLVRHVVSPFDLSRTLLVGGGLLVPCSLPGPPVLKQLMQIITMVPGQSGQFQSVCFP